MLKTVFLDLDDTLLDFRRGEAEALHRALEAFGLPSGRAVQERFHELNRQQWELLEQGAVGREELFLRRFQLLLEELGSGCSCRALSDAYEENLGESCILLPGAEELLGTLSSRWALYLVSNGSSAVQRSRIRRAGIGPFFREIFLSEELGAAKPSPEYFRACFEAIPDFSRSEAVMIGDSLTSDILGGKQAGLRTCWFNPEGKPCPPKLRPDWEISALSELPALLERL